MAMTRGNGLSLSINTDLDMSQAQKTYRELVNDVSRRKLNIPLDVKIDEIVPKLDNVLNNKVGKKVEESFNRINTKFQNITRTVKKEFEEIGKDGNIEKVTKNVTEHLTKVTETFKNNIGDVKERVSIWGENNEYLASSLKNVQQGVENITTNTKSFYQIIDNVQTKVTEVTKTITDTNGAEQKVIERTKEWTDANGKLHKTVDTLDADSNKLKATITTIVEPISQIQNSISSVHKFTSELGNLVTETVTFNEKGEKLVTTVTEEEKGIGRLQKTTKVYNETLGQTVSTNIQLVNDETKLAQARKQQEKETQKQLQAQQVLEKYITQEKTQVSDMVGSYEALVTTTREVSASGKELITVVTQYTNSAGQLVTQVEKLDEAQRNVEATTITYEQKLQDVQSVVENTIVSIHKYQTELGNIVTETTTFNEKGEKIITTITEEDDGLGRLQRTTKVYNDTLKEVVKTEIQMVNDETKRADATTKVKDSTEKAAESAKKYNTYTKQAAKETRTFGQALTDALKRLVRYYIASLPIQAVRKTISETITTIKEFDSALIEFRKVSDLAGESLTRYVSKLAEMGEITGSTMQAMVEASTEFKKSGFSEEDSAKLASIAEKYRNIADEEISAGEAASFIIAQMKAFNIEADQAEHIIDAVNEVANNFAVSSADLAKNLGNMSAIMAINNVSMEEQIGMLTGVTEITRKAATASRGLVMISSRLTQVLDDTSSTGKKLTKIYNDLGIELKDENGQLRSHYDILGDLAEKWDSLSENQQKYIALTSAGARQQQNFVALMSNWENVAEATTKAYDSLGSAQKENEKVMDSVAKKVEILKSQFQQLVIGKGGLQDFAKGILNVGIALLKFANTDAAKAIAVFIALESTLVLVRKAWIALQAASSTNILASAITSLIAGEVTLGQVTSVLTKKFIENAIAWAATPMGMATIAVAAIVSMIYALNKMNSAFEDATNHTKELADAANQTKTEVDNLKKELDEISEKIKDVEEQKLKITEESELKKLKDITSELISQESSLKRQLVLQQALLEKQNEEAEKAAKEALSSPAYVEWKVEPTAQSVLPTPVAHYADEELEKITQQYKEASVNADIYKGVLEKLDAESKHDTETYNNVSQKLYETEQEMSRLQSEGTDLAEGLVNNANALKSNDTETQNLKNSIYALTDEFFNAIGVTQEVDKILNDTTLSEEELAEQAAELEENLKSAAEAIGLTATELEGLRNIFQDDEKLNVFLSQLAAIKQEISDTSTVIDNLQESLETASSALDEYNEKGYLTLDTFQALMGISAQYLAALVNEEGQLEINQTTLGNLVEQLKIAKIQELAQAAAMEIAANHTEYAGKASANAVGSVAAIGNTIQAVGNQAATAAGQVASFGQTVSAFSGISFSQMTAEDKKILNYYKDIAKSLSEIEVNTTKAGNAASKAGKKGAGAAKEAKDATKELNKELDKEKEKYDKVITFITGRIDKQIKAIQKAKEEEVKAIEATIKAREKEKDNALDNIEKQINALEKEKDAREKYWDDQIDALKKANDQRKDALELQEKLDALERAKNTKVKVYKEGQGFVYDVDQTAVAEAQKALDEYLSEKAYEDELTRLEALKDAEIDNYNKRLDALNAYKDRVQESYEKQIEALNAHKEALEEQYDAQIEYYNNFKDKFEEMVKAYEDSQTALLAKELTGIDFEKDNWMTRLDNLAEFVNKYNALQQKIGAGTTDNKNDATMSSGTTYTPSSTKTGTTVSGSKMTPQEREQAARVQHQKVVVNKHASGISSISDNEIALVGENPNQELVIGSKINNGQLMSLDKGTGVVNANSSRTLAGMLNQVGQFGSSGFGSGNGTLNSNINNDTLTINGVTIQGANIKDPETFVNGLLNLKAEALQRAYRHR